MMDKVELLAPAGDLERLKINLLYGADAVYFGGEKFGMRANATNFSKEEIKQACNFAHKLQKKVYLTLNIVFHNEEIEPVYDYMKEVVAFGIDAFIVSDPSLIPYIKENFPQVEVHLSTQNSTTNYETVLFFKDQGVDRIVLARELNKKQIKEIIDKTKIDIEVFIHGAMCTCMSGRCALSNYITNRDANRGGCSQVCRFNFQTKSNQDFTMATKDLNMAEYIKDLIEIGVKSLKIEGRMRSIYYLATVVGAYRKIIDAYYDKSLTDEFLKQQKQILSRVANRETSTHYFNKEANYKDQYYTGRVEISNQDYLGQVISYENKLLKFYERNYFKVGDTVELFTPKKESIIFTVEKLYDENKNKVEVARHPDNIYYLFLDTDILIEEYSMLRLIQS